MSEYIIKLANADCMVGSPFDTPYLREEIVRCRDCKFYDEDDGYGNYGCTLFDFSAKGMDDGYCAWAERRTDE